MSKNVIQRLSDLPEWNCILNIQSSPFVGPSDGGMLAACQIDAFTPLAFESMDWTSYKNAGVKPIDVWLLVDSPDPVKITGMMSRLQGYRAFVLRGVHVCSKEVLESVRESFVARLGLNKKTNESDEHALFDEIGQDALSKGVSDIHITLHEDRARVAYRIKGELRHARDLPVERATALVRSAYNTLSEKGSTKEGFNERENQDAVIERAYPEGLVRFRYSGIPIAPSGADITLRLIPIGVGGKVKTLAELGFSEDQCDLLERIFTRSSGLVLVAGTTGSGKSTTLVSVLSEMAAKNPGKKIRSIEEPVEYKIAGVYQTPVRRKDGDDSNPFALALRQLMRADPDVIMVGEVRDIDTAQLAIQGVRSGHMLVSTIHADGAPACFDRLSGMGVDRKDLASVGLIAGLVYQKLVPILCNHCKVSYAQWASGPSFDAKLDKRLRSVLKSYPGAEGANPLSQIYFRDPSGCEHCGHDGLSGREVVAEILRPTPAMTRAIMEADSPFIWSQWRATIDANNPDSMRGRTAFEHAIVKMRQGRVEPGAVEESFRYLDEVVFDGGAV